MSRNTFLTLLVLLVAGGAFVAWRYRPFYVAKWARSMVFSSFEDGFGVRFEPEDPERHFHCPGAEVVWEGRTAVLTLVRTPKSSSYVPECPAEPIPGSGFWIRVPFPEGYDPYASNTRAVLRDPLGTEKVLSSGYRKVRKQIDAPPTDE